MIRLCVPCAVLLALVAINCGGETGRAADSGPPGVAALQRTNAFERLTERTPSHTSSAPSFVVDPGWPKPLPHNWIIGDIGGLAADRQDHIWVYHRPRALDSTDSGALGSAGKNPTGGLVSALGHPRPYGQQSGCCIPAPSVLEFDKAGNLIQAWGGPSDPGFLDKRCRQEDGCFWPAREHGIFVDHNDFVYLAGNGLGADFHAQYPWAPNSGNDSQVLKFKRDGTFVMQIGRAGAKGPNSNDTNGGVNGTPQPFLPADMSVDPNANRLYIADGYGNRRILIVDAATGKYIGHFGAYGQNPVREETPPSAAQGESVASWADEFRRGELKPRNFRSPIHCAKLTRDGFLYGCDRGNNRVQVFKIADVGKPCDNPNGEVGKCGFVGELHVAPQTTAGTSGTIDFSNDPNQSCAYVADLSNDTVYEINRQNLQELDRFGTGGRQIGQFHWPHSLTVDSEGNIYTGEVDTAGRVQRFVRYGASSCSGTGSADVGRYRQPTQ